MKADQYPQNRTNECTLRVVQTEREKERERGGEERNERKGVEKQNFPKPLYHPNIDGVPLWTARITNVWMKGQGVHGKLSTLARWKMLQLAKSITWNMPAIFSKKRASRLPILFSLVISISYQSLVKLSKQRNRTRKNEKETATPKISVPRN